MLSMPDVYARIFRVAFIAVLALVTAGGVRAAANQRLRSSRSARIETLQHDGTGEFEAHRREATLPARGENGLDLRSDAAAAMPAAAFTADRFLPLHILQPGHTSRASVAGAYARIRGRAPPRS